MLRDVEWRIAPGERTGILGANGAGKSTLLGLIAGTIAADTGRVKRGKTVRSPMLDQQVDELTDSRGRPVREVIGRLRAGYQVDGPRADPGPAAGATGVRARPAVGARQRPLRRTATAAAADAHAAVRAERAACSTSPPTTSTPTC